MGIHEPQVDLDGLISALDAIGIDRLKRHGYERYVDELVDVSRKCCEVDGTYLIIVIQFIKSYREPCFQRDVLLDVLNKLVTSQNFTRLLIKPFPVEKCDSWDSLATSITAIPDLIANCKCLDRFPGLRQGAFYERLTNWVSVALQHHSQMQVEPRHELKYFLLKIIGRITLSEHKQLVWTHLTSNALQKPPSRAQLLYHDLIRFTLSSHNDHVPFTIYMESLCLPIFSGLRPSANSGPIIRSILGNSVATNEQLRYIICDKSIFKSNYNLAKEKQAVILFNIAAYLSSLVTTTPHIDRDRCDNESEGGSSLLIETLLEIVRNWTSSTRILVRTYQHSKYITYALAVFLRHAIQYDKKSIVDHAAKVQTMIARSMPTYLNRASQEQRNLATCLSKLVLPKMYDLVIHERQMAKDEKNEELKLDFNVAPNDDLLYLQQLFQQDAGVLFRDLADITTTTTTTATTKTTPQMVYPELCVASLETITTNTTHRPMAAAAAGTGTTTTATNDKIMSAANRQANDKQLHGETKESIAGGGGGGAARGGLTRRMSKRRAVVELDDQVCESEAKVDNDSDDDSHSAGGGHHGSASDAEDDLMPYKIGEPCGDISDDDEFALGEDATNVPIYLRDCINGLTENNSRLYVRLCLIKAGVLVNDLIEQDRTIAQTKQQSRGNFSIAHQLGRQNSDVQPQHKSRVNDTMSDVGIELARALLFIDNQFNIDNFDQHRRECLVALCYAAPDLVGKYLIDEFNGHNRSAQQQLDILYILVSAAHQLSTGSRTKGGPEAPKLQEALCVRAPSSRTVNGFAPYSALFFYGIVYRLKADFADASALIISQPKSIMSAFRQQSDGQRSCASATGQSADVIVKRAIAQEGRKEVPRPTGPSEASARLVETREDVENFLETNCLSDDSLLLSRILLAIANIISCSAQQMITCKLSSDLLDILSAYRCHPDSGVQRAMVNCLRIIREATPRTYYTEHIEGRMVRLFGPWLSENEANM